jgi:cysteine desulfurase/selenocysteine lyase
MLTETSRQQDFPPWLERTYLNTAAEGIPPHVVTQAVDHYLQDKQLGMDGRKRHETQWRAAQQQIARLIGLTADEIGICSSSSEAFNLAAIALRLQRGDEIVVNDLDFPSGITSWLQTPATVRVWRSQEGALRIEDLIPLLGPRTRLVSASLVSFYNGYKLVLSEVAAAVRHNSPALIGVDVTQALGRIPLDISAADLVVSSTYKWLLAIHGGGIVGVPKHRAAELTVPVGGWFNLQDPFSDERFERVTNRPGAASFTVGMPNYATVYAIAAAAEYLNTIGVVNIQQHAEPLVKAALEGLKKLPVELLTPDESEHLAGILAFRHYHAEQLHQYLAEQKIHVMHNAGRLRIAIHGYNTMTDIDRFLSTMHSALKSL